MENPNNGNYTKDASENSILYRNQANSEHERFIIRDNSTFIEAIEEFYEYLNAYFSKYGNHAAIVPVSDFLKWLKSSKIEKLSDYRKHIEEGLVIIYTFFVLWQRAISGIFNHNKHQNFMDCIKVTMYDIVLYFGHTLHTIVEEYLDFICDNITPVSYTHLTLPTILLV